MDKLIEIFRSLEIPVRYLSTKEKLSVPFGIYKRINDENFYADNERYYIIENYQLELYFIDLKEQKKIEEKLERKLEENRISFTKSEDIELDDSKTFVKYYYIGVLRYARENSK